MNKVALHNILGELMFKYGICTTKELNKFLGIKTGGYIIRGRLEKTESHEYVSYISKFIFEGLFQ